MEVRARVPDPTHAGQGAADSDTIEIPSHDRPTRVLLVEDDPDLAALITDTLAQSARAFELEPVARLDEALGALERQDYDVMLVDSAVACSLAHRLPVVVLTAGDDPSVAVAAIRAGAQDALAKDALDPDELPRVLLRAIKRHPSVRDHYERIVAPDRPTADGVDDPETGILSERGFADRLGRSLANAARTGSPFSVLQIDVEACVDSQIAIDGDELIGFAHALGSCTRHSDSVARLAERRFAVVLHAADGREALHGATGVIVDALTGAFDECVGGRNASRVVRVYGALVRDPAGESPTSVMALARRSPLAVVEVRDPEVNPIVVVGRGDEGDVCGGVQ